MSGPRFSLKRVATSGGKEDSMNSQWKTVIDVVQGFSVSSSWPPGISRLVSNR